MDTDRLHIAQELSAMADAVQGMEPYPCPAPPARDPRDLERWFKVAVDNVIQPGLFTDHELNDLCATRRRVGWCGTYRDDQSAAIRHLRAQGYEY